METIVILEIAFGCLGLLIISKCAIEIFNRAVRKIDIEKLRRLNRRM